MKETILFTEIPREKGWLYFTGTDARGNITVMKAPMGKKKKKNKNESM